LVLLFSLKGEMGREAQRRKKPETRLADFRDGRDENNLAEFPLSLLADRVPKGQKSVEYQDTITDWKTGQVVHRRVCITGSDKFGLPTSKDEDVLLALVQLTKIRNGFTSSEVFFTKHQVIEVLGWQNRGWAYERVEESLHRWKGVSVHYWNAWRDNAKETWKDSEAIGILEYVRISDGRRTKGGRTNHADSGSQIVWNKMFFESFRAGYLKKLDFQTYRSLKRPAARRAYRFLDKRFHHSDVWEFDLRVFACEKLGFSRGYDTGQLKERVQPALDELVTVGFMESPRYEKQAPGVWKIHVRRTFSVDRSVTEVGACDITQVLMARGIGASIAARLAKDYSRDQIEEKVRFFDALICRKDSRALQNPAGFLVSAIRDDYAVAKGRIGPGTDRKSTASKGKVPPAPCEPVRGNISNADKPVDVDDVTRLRSYEQAMSGEQRVVLEKRALSEATAFEHRTLERLQATNPVLWAQLRDKLVMACLEREGTLSRKE
jgi:hypothetical protein